MYHVDDPINFMTSFYGCLIAGIIPVPIEPPASKDVSSFFWLPSNSNSSFYLHYLLL